MFVGIVILAAVAGILATYLVMYHSSQSRVKSQISPAVAVELVGLKGQQVVAVGTILNSSLSFYSGDSIGVGISFVYMPYPGDPNTIKIVSVNDSDGFAMSTVQPSLPIILGGNPHGVQMTVLLVTPSSSYSGDLHLNVTFYVPPPPA